MFLDIEIENVPPWSPMFFKNVGFETVLVTKKICSGDKSYKYFIGHLSNNYKVKPLHVMLSETSAYVKRSDGQSKWIYVFIEDDDLTYWKSYNSISDKFSADIKKKNLKASPPTKKKFLKAKIKFYCDEVEDFYDKEIPKVNSKYTCLTVISLDSSLKKDENFHLQVL